MSLNNMSSDVTVSPLTTTTRRNTINIKFHTLSKNPVQRCALSSPSRSKQHDPASARILLSVLKQKSVYSLRQCFLDGLEDHLSYTKL
jgi:hypothetical protein